MIGFQLACILKLFGMKGLSLLHGDIRLENIYLTKGVEDDQQFPEMKLINFTDSFFIDEVSTIDLPSKLHTAPELKRYANITNF